MVKNASDDSISVAAVCGTQVRIYGELHRGATVRHLLRVLDFPSYGAAKLYAEEYEEGQRGGNRG
jgi:hypothetical protein